MIHFEIEGKAQPQGRPRAVRMGAGVRMYDPPKSKAYKQMVAAKVRSYMKINGIQTITEPIAVHLNFYFIPPKSYSNKRIRAIEAKEELFTKRLDLDNLVKSVTDGMNSIMYLDDSQIVRLTAGKHYGHKDYVDVKIKVIKDTKKYYEENSFNF